MTGWRGCTTPDCHRPEHCRGLCMRHYAKAREAGQLDSLPSRRYRGWQQQCTVEDCAGWQHARGLCARHYKTVLATERQAVPRTGAGMK